MTRIGDLKFSGHNYQLCQDKDGYYWSIHFDYITKGRLNRQINGLQGLRCESRQGSIDLAELDAKRRKFQAENPNHTEMEMLMFLAGC